ncbi:MAG: prolyl oligopeptidase family serine peptidase [Chloroflexota bacterium]|nr:prolyl oligopeptidase family serine peptidase [Chloroflexota bacterium]
MKQQKMTFEKLVTKTVQLKYLLYLPQDYDGDSDTRWPLILFLHGAGERGDDLELVKIHGIPKIVEERDNFPFITVSPQCPKGSLWNDHFEALEALLREAEETYRVDPERIYLTGLSMGGYGSWHFATLHPKRFAAVVPICGGAMPMYGFPERVSVLKDVPIWAFHGAKDSTVPIEESQKLVDVLKEHEGNVRFTVYPDAEHDSWTRTYDNPELYEWLLQQRRRGC